MRVLLNLLALAFFINSTVAIGLIAMAFAFAVVDDPKGIESWPVVVIAMAVFIPINIRTGRYLERHDWRIIFP